MDGPETGAVKTCFVPDERYNYFLSETWGMTSSLGRDGDNLLPVPWLFHDL
jgi:hypothetical protein